MNLTYVTSVAMLGASIAFHELGHFLACKLVGVPVPVFSVGVGPGLSLVTKKTEYRFSPVLIAGYVTMDKDYKQTATQDFLVSMAGPVFSVLAGLLCMQVAIAALGYGWNPVDLFQVLGVMAHDIGIPHIEAKDVMSVVGIVKVQAATKSVPDFWWTAGLINISIGATNLLPVPPLDGGRMILAAIRGTTGKEMKGLATAVSVVGAVLLLGVLGLGLYNDLWR